MRNEIRHRIQVALWAYAYEVMSDSLVSDAVFDATCNQINSELSTGNKTMDDFFRAEFVPFTGQWIYKHPDIYGIMNLYLRLTGKSPIDPRGTVEASPQPIGQVTSRKMPFDTHSDNMIWLASLGFRVVPHIRSVNGISLQFEFEDDLFFTVTPFNGGQFDETQTKSIAYKDYFQSK